MASPAERLRTTMAASRVSFTWFGVRKALTPEQRARAAETFFADAPFLSAGKKLLETQHAAFRAVTAIRTRITDEWRSASLPFPEPGVRLMRQDQIERFDGRMAASRIELDQAVVDLDRHYGELRQAAAQRLGSLYNPADYPETLTGLFAVAWDYPNIEPPDYLVALNPALYRQEQERVRHRFDEAVRLAEEAFLSEFGRLVSHLSERLGGNDEDGSPRVFRDTAVGNLRAFFERFRSLNVSSNAQLDALVEQAQSILRGVAPQDLRDRQGLRQHVADRLTHVQTAIDALMVDRPRRRILRSAPAEGAA